MATLGPPIPAATKLDVVKDRVTSPEEREDVGSNPTWPIQPLRYPDFNLGLNRPVVQRIERLFP